MAESANKASEEEEEAMQTEETDLAREEEQIEEEEEELDDLLEEDEEDDDDEELLSPQEPDSEPTNGLSSPTEVVPAETPASTEPQAPQKVLEDGGPDPAITEAGSKSQPDPRHEDPEEATFHGFPAAESPAVPKGPESELADLMSQETPDRSPVKVHYTLAPRSPVIKGAVTVATPDAKADKPAVLPAAAAAETLKTVLGPGITLTPSSKGSSSSAPAATTSPTPATLPTAPSAVHVTASITPVISPKTTGAEAPVASAPSAVAKDPPASLVSSTRIRIPTPKAMKIISSPQPAKRETREWRPSGLLFKPLKAGKFK